MHGGERKKTSVAVIGTAKKKGRLRKMSRGPLKGAAGKTHPRNGGRKRQGRKLGKKPSAKIRKTMLKNTNRE